MFGQLRNCCNKLFGVVFIAQENPTASGSLVFLMCRVGLHSGRSIPDVWQPTNPITPLNSFEADSCPDMAISTKDWPKILRAVDEAIRKAIEPLNVRIDSLHPHGWRKAAHLLRELGPLASVIGTVLTLLAITIGSLYYSFSRVEKEAAFETNTTRTLGDINGHLKKIDEIISTQRIEQAGANPTDKGSAIEAKQAIDSARQNSIQLPSDLVEHVGQRFVEASSQNVQAWGTAIGFINYKSSVNKAAPPMPPLDDSKALITNYETVSVPGTPMIQLSHYGIVPRAVAAQLSFIGHDPNKNLDRGNAILVAQGGTIILDGMQIKNVIFQNVEIHYAGGPINLTSVYFINCIFKMESAQKSRDLAIALLSPGSSTTYSGM
jgi:hypothetical protein